MTDYSKFKVADAFKHLDPEQGLAEEGITGGGFPSIRYRQKAWSLQYGGQNYPFKREDDNTPLSYIDVIIVGTVPWVSKSYFGSDEYTEDSAGGPVCASLKGVVPDPGVPMKQSESCGICRHNEFGSKGGGGKACQDYKRVAVLLMPNMTRKMFDNKPLIEPVFLKIPPNSLLPWKRYREELAHAGLPFAAVVTRVAFESDKWKMKFETTSALSNAEAKVVFKMMDDPQTTQILGSQPELRQLAPPPQEDKGLLAAFGQPEEDKPKRGGRPPGSKNKPKQIESASSEGFFESQKSSDNGKAAASTDRASYEESDGELDDIMAKVMGDKMKGML